MISKVLKVGDRVEMKKWVTADTPDEKPRLYNSQLVEITDNSKINILIPIEGGRIIPLEVGSRYELSFVTTTGIYMCKAEILNRCKQGNVYFLVMLILSELRKEQRRQYFRLEKIRPLTYHRLTNEEREIIAALSQGRYKDDYEKRFLQMRLKDTKGEEISGTLSNISGGGMKFHSSKELQKGEFIRIKILLEDLDTEEMDLFARVIASNRSLNAGLEHEHRIEFILINRDTREKIVKYVFNEDRKQRQKEKGIY